MYLVRKTKLPGHLFRTTPVRTFIMGIPLMVLFWACTGGKVSERSTENVDDVIKVVSFNIRFDNPRDGVNNWHYRKSAIVAFLRSEAADLIGMQEVVDNQFSYLKEKLPGYGTVGVGREDGATKGEYVPLFYKKGRFTLLDSGTFWLSETPGVPSVGWDAALERICTYAFLVDKRNDRKVHFYNTHFDHIGSEAKLQSARLLGDSIASKSGGNWVILAGDLNTEPGSSPYHELIDGVLTDSYASKIRLGPEGTFNGFDVQSAYERRIDYLLINGFSSELYVCNNLSFNGNFISDHFPVIALLAYHKP